MIKVMGQMFMELPIMFDQNHPHIFDKIPQKHIQAIITKIVTFS